MLIIACGWWVIVWTPWKSTHTIMWTEPQGTIYKVRVEIEEKEELIDAKRVTVRCGEEQVTSVRRWASSVSRPLLQSYLLLADGLHYRTLRPWPLRLVAILWYVIMISGWEAWIDSSMISGLNRSPVCHWFIYFFKKVAALLYLTLPSWAKSLCEEWANRSFIRSKLLKLSRGHLGRTLLWPCSWTRRLWEELINNVKERADRPVIS